MTYTRTDKRLAEVVIDCRTTNLNLFEVLGRMDAMKASGRYSDFYLSEYQIYGVLA